MSERPVTTDALETLGMIHKTAQHRDAIHLAVEPVTAGEKLWPGQHITVKGGVAWIAKKGQGLGIVDPFLDVPAMTGDRFWFIMYPRQVRSLRHVWTHEAFPDDAKPATGTSLASEMFIAEFAKDAGLDRDEVLAGANDYLDSGEYLCDGGRWQGFSTPPEFWDHFEVVTGRKVDKDKRGGFFTCSC